MNPLTRSAIALACAAIAASVMPMESAHAASASADCRRQAREIIRRAFVGQPATRQIYVDIAGRTTRATLLGADKNALTVRVLGSEMPLRWSLVSDRRLYQIAKKYARSARDFISLSRLASAAGMSEESRACLTDAARLDPKLAAAARIAPSSAGRPAVRRVAMPRRKAPVAKGSLKNMPPITVRDYSNARRRGAPVSGGVPFPKGLLKASDVSRLILADSRGNRVPSFQQPVVLSKWHDGSVKWLLLDFAADVPAGGAAKFRLQTGSRSGGGPAIRIEDAGATYVVDTGPLKVALHKRRFSFIERAWVDTDGDGRADELVVDRPGEMFIDLDAASPGPADGGIGAFRRGDKVTPGIEGGNWMRDSKAKTATRYRASIGEYRLSLYRRGAIHTVFKMDGWHKSRAGRQFGKYTLYLHFYAGRREMKVQHTWVMTGDPEKNFVRRMGISLPLAGKPDSFAFGGEFEQAAGGEALKGPSRIISGSVPSSGEAYILSVGPDKYYHNVPRTADRRVEYTVQAGGRKVAAGYGASGWGCFRNARVGIAAGVRDFYREHPKEIHCGDGVVTAYIWPDHGGKTLDLRRRFPECRGYYNEVGTKARRCHGPAGSSVGAAKTTELFFSFEKGGASASEIDARFRGFEEPLLPFVTGPWNCATGVWGPVNPYDPKKRAGIENFIDLSFQWQFAAQREFGWYGMYDWGEHLIEYACQRWELPNWPANPGTYSNWGYSGWSSGFDTGQFMLLQYFRSGRYRYYRLGEAKIKHNRDVNVVHWEKPDDGPLPKDNNGSQRLGGGHRHDQQHWGAYLTGYAIPNIGNGHLYFLTGDGRCQDAYRNIAEYHAKAPSIENEGRLTLSYIGEVLGEQKWIDMARKKLATSGDCRPANSAFGRNVVSNMMALMLWDAGSGDAALHRKVIEWGNALSAGRGQGSAGTIYLWSYLKATEKSGAWDAKIRAAQKRILPDNLGRLASMAPESIWKLSFEQTQALYRSCRGSAPAGFSFNKPWGNFVIAMLAWAPDELR